MDETLEKRTIAKVTWRIIPFLIVCYFVSFLDRVNLGFAGAAVSKHFAFSATVFGFGAGIFFIGYFLFEVPSNILLDKFGARRWIARIMLTWGLISGATAFIQGETSFYVIRFLLGVAEAGFFPGIILYLTYWFPAAYRARIVGWFMVAIPVSSVIGAPVSQWVLSMDGAAGLAGWQWLFLIEAAPSVLLAFVVLGFLTDKPRHAAWLAADERAWLDATLEAERRRREAVKKFGLREALTNPRVLLLSLVYFGDVAALYGMGFWLPQILGPMHLSPLANVGALAIPYAVGAVGMVLWVRRSDRSGERKLHTAIPAFVAALGLALVPFLSDPAAAVAALCVAALGIFAMLPVFWTLPTAFLTGTAAAGGIALVNSIGNLSGYVGPLIVGWLKDQTGGYAGGIWFLAACAFSAGVIVLLLGHRPEFEKLQARGEAAAD
ncbi:MFS transporter [Aliidongia dinghuensis]|uniref:MFS transporter n=1 Tax=Aliidongia dinghuensis TaxID=1867774 RepID=A0A8J2YXM4_9PROT|nr:MFS transporter [Aliidongia dinghuensis]GGF34024.1 MFS transporter [Aliidongia dinghuensis]